MYIDWGAGIFSKMILLYQGSPEWMRGHRTTRWRAPRVEKSSKKELKEREINKGGMNRGYGG